MNDNDNIIDRGWMLAFLKKEREDTCIPETQFLESLTDTMYLNDCEPDIVFTRCESENLFGGGVDTANELSKRPFLKDHELIQVGEKNGTNVIYFLVSSPAKDPGEPCLRLLYYESEVAYLNGNLTGIWTFVQNKRSNKTRITAFDIYHLWSLFPGDYVLFGSERVFSVKLYAVDEKQELISSAYQYPIWLMTGNLDTLEFVPTQRELKKAVAKVTKNKDASQNIYVICGRTCLISNDPEETRSLLYRAILTLLNQPSFPPRQAYWIPFIKYDYTVANLSGSDTQDEADYRLKEWMDFHKEDYSKWDSFKKMIPFEGRDSTIASDPVLYFRTKKNAFAKLEEMFPFIKDQISDIPMHIDGWTSDGKNADKRNRQSRKQPIRTLIFAALGINREQYKYLHRQSKSSL